MRTYISPLSYKIHEFLFASYATRIIFDRRLFALLLTCSLDSRHCPLPFFPCFIAHIGRSLGVPNAYIKAHNIPNDIL